MNQFDPLEAPLQRAVRAYIVTGLLFMLLPGTFLGVWNLIAMSAAHGSQRPSAAWVQAHGHAQIFGWIGTFVMGIGFYSLSKMGTLRSYVVRRAWFAWALWMAGVGTRWATGVYGIAWRFLLPLSAALEVAAFLIFFVTVRQHKPKPVKSDLPILSNAPTGWMKLVVSSTVCFLLALLWHLGTALCVAVRGIGPQFPKSADQHLLTISVWGFLVLSVWGFNARWLPMFGGLRRPSETGLRGALSMLITGLLLNLAGFSTTAAFAILVAVTLAATSIRVFQPAVQPAKSHGVHPSWITFARCAYVWLFVSAALAIWASLSDTHGGIVGASRHAVTVGFVGTMVFTIGSRMLPGYCGTPKLYSTNLMLAALLFLNLGCALRVGAEIPAYEGYLPSAWSVLPISAITELSAVALFAANMLATVAQLRFPVAFLFPRKALSK